MFRVWSTHITIVLGRRTRPVAAPLSEKYLAAVPAVADPSYGWHPAHGVLAQNLILAPRLAVSALTEYAPIMTPDVVEAALVMGALPKKTCE